MLTIAQSTVTENIIALAYLAAAVCFVLGLKWMSAVPTARRGNAVSSLGMLIAIIATLFYIHGDQLLSLVWIAVALAIGSAAGILLAVRTPMTGMPQMVALLNGFGGIASLLVAWGDYLSKAVTQIALDAGTMLPARPGNDDLWIVWSRPWHEMLAIGLTVLVGGVTFTGSLVAFGKLQGLKITPGRPVQFAGQNFLNAAMVLIGLAGSIALVFEPQWGWLIIPIAVASLLLGVLLVIGIGGADMPVVISLLNSYSGIAAAFAGFVLGNSALIITGSLVGASGLILTNIMCKAMNRSLLNVLFGGVGAPGSGGSGGSGGGAAGGEKGEVRTFSIEDAAIVLEAARQVMVVPGYGMAVAQAQHSVRELADELEKRGIKVYYAIHPVAGRMPGHMNVLLAEANVPYDELLDLEASNAQFEQTDVALVIGANDVTNPSARTAKDSPIYGMPILDVDKARTIFVIKRSMNPGFAGVENELYYDPKCGMVFGDAKKVVAALTSELKSM
ncbi:MAG: NAD(P)(+) transhydrogenase (Re/Si-specific) subunit beta [Phycisphaeraceae bacterium]